MRYKRMRHNGQSVLEYALMVVMISAALIAMAVFINRSVNSNVKVLDDHFEAKPR